MWYICKNMIHFKTMKRFFIIALLALALQPLRAGTVVTDTLYSRILGGSSIIYNVYLPDGYEIASRTFPAVYLLHGLSDDHTAWRDKGQMQIVTDELLRSGEASPMVIIMPAAGGPDVRHTWCGYFNMPGWNYEDFFFGEFIPAVEKKYHCGGAKSQRAVMGLSMGGGGSVVYCQRHPDMFSSCYAMSPWLDEPKGEVGGWNEEKDCLYYTCKSVHEHSANDFVANADEATLEKLRTVAWVVDCGDDDFLLHLSMDFHMKMRNAGVHSELRVRDGVHNWEYWHLALRLALPFASRNFK